MTTSYEQMLMYCLIQVITFQEEFGLTAVAVNSSNGGCSKRLARVSDIAARSPDIMY